MRSLKELFALLFNFINRLFSKKTPKSTSKDSLHKATAHGYHNSNCSIGYKIRCRRSQSKRRKRERRLGKK